MCVYIGVCGFVCGAFCYVCDGSVVVLWWMWGRVQAMVVMVGGNVVMFGSSGDGLLI